ncbi:MAG: 5-oxoprolinase subunit PxpB [Pseudomonadales bacterium]|nr:5-oxoprolinase subunit PxpB [Pseudomonadales bacterium]
MFRIEIAGENALIIVFADKINDKAFSLVQQATTLIRQQLSEKVVDLIPSYASVLVQFDLLVIDHFQLQNSLRALLSTLQQTKKQSNEIISLPVYYSKKSGPDLERIAQHTQLSIEAIIECHHSQIYQVYAIGFAPGFAYLGQVNPKIATPRLDSPRLKVPKGAVAIADQQTAIYPNQSPGGWNIIGLCPLDMFNPNQRPHMPIQVGDQVKFKPITEQSFIDLGGTFNDIV